MNFGGVKKRNRSMNRKLSDRLLEILPGFISWNLILFPVWGSFLAPQAVAYFVLAFDVFWLYRSIWVAAAVFLVHLKMSAAEKHDFFSEVSHLEDWQKIHHLVIIPTYKEPLHILQRTIWALANQDFPREQISLVLAIEKREGENAETKAQKLLKQFGGDFANFLITRHPDLPGEVKGKSSNEAWAGKIAKRILVDQDPSALVETETSCLKNNSRPIELDFTTITTVDADVKLHPKYFSYLAFAFLTNPFRFRRFWQGAILFYQNIDRIPAFARVVNILYSMSQIAVLGRKERLINYSSYSLSLKMLSEVGFWDTDVIPEDYRIFFKCFFAFDGEVEVEPLFLPILADAAEGENFLGTLRATYQQQQRWAWGVSDDPKFLLWWLTTKTTSFWNKTIRVGNALLDHLLWPVNWFLLTLGATLPPLLNPVFAQTVLGKNLPRFSSLVLTITLLFLLVVLVIDWQRRPAPSGRLPLLRKGLNYLEFLLMPVVSFFLAALPGLDAHTRLMLGKYLEYKVTEKR